MIILIILNVPCKALPVNTMTHSSEERKALIPFFMPCSFLIEFPPISFVGSPTCAWFFAVRIFKRVADNRRHTAFATSDLTLQKWQRPHSSPPETFVGWPSPPPPSLIQLSCFEDWLVSFFEVATSHIYKRSSFLYLVVLQALVQIIEIDLISKVRGNSVVFLDFEFKTFYFIAHGNGHDVFSITLSILQMYYCWY